MMKTTLENISWIIFVMNFKNQCLIISALSLNSQLSESGQGKKCGNYNSTRPPPPPPRPWKSIICKQSKLLF